MKTFFLLLGNEDFQKVYFNVWGITEKSDVDGCNKYRYAVSALTAKLPETSTKQTTTDPATLFQQAAVIQAGYQQIVRDIAAAVDGIQASEVSLPSALKKMGRIIEKTILKRKKDQGNANKVCDIVRGMITCDNMSQVASVIDGICSSDAIVVTRVKDRFFTAPSAGGWRDCMINFYIASDPNQHICEIQLVHKMMLTARKGLPGHAVYNRVRNASELVVFINPATPKDKKELQAWLIRFMKDQGKKYRHPNTYDVSQITNMSDLFDHDELREFNEPIGKWNVSNCTEMYRMFATTTAFNQPIGDWKVDNVTNMNGMFINSSAFNQPINKWNVSKVTDMSMMFKC